MKKTLVTLSLTLLVVSLFVFIACNKDSSGSSSNTSTNPNHIPADQTVTASLQGRVLDENGLPMQGASVSSGTATTTTDVNGVFTFQNISLSSRFGFVKVVKQGYFTGSRSIITNAGASNFVSISMQPRTSKGTFAAAAGGTITVTTGCTAAFDTSSVVTAATNAPYTGIVNVYATYLDPTASDLYKHMPGDLRGIDSTGNETAIQSFGMMVVELEGSAGEKLQIAPGKKANLTWAIPASLQAIAPASIPLWYFNDSTGKWIEQGTATRQGTSYVGQVGHFSYWNCDAPMGTVNFKVRLIDQHGNALAYNYIQFTSTTAGIRGGYTDSTGFAQGLIPKGQSLNLQVLSECGNFLGGASVGPALTDQDLGTITINVSYADLTLTGTVVNCSNNPVDSGAITVLVDGLNYAAVVKNGSFKLPVLRCFSTTVSVTLTATDYIALQTGSPVTIKADSGSVNAGQLSACGSSYSQLITCTINGNTYSWPSPPASISYSPGELMGTSGGNIIYLLPQNALTATGAYPLTLILYSTTTSFYGSQAQLNVSSFGAVSSYVTGTITGNVTDSTTHISYPVTGSLNVLRTQ